ncbi:MAG: flagellar hook-basal body protein [Solirubrobacterales bacterium]|nr:flagellar hook-basal body protein [Solirubrobacterales bacterium]
MYTAAAGMAAQQTRLDAVANDLANVNTTGYKHVRVAFRDLVYADAGYGGNQGVQLGAGAAARTVGRSLQQGTMQTTGQPLDLAISGPGFFQVRLADGRTAITRDGALGLDGQGNLRLHTGELLQPPVKLPTGTDPERVAIGPDGTVTIDKKSVGKIQLVDVPAPGALDGGPDNTFLPTTGSGAIRNAAATTTIQQGALESSNTDAAEAFTNMIESQRAFELASKALTTQDEILGIANQVKK